MRSYDFSGRNYQYEIKPQNVEVDYRRKVLTLTATYSGFGKDPIVQEFELLRVRRCEKCGEPVSIQAAVSMKAMEQKAEMRLFPKAWEYGSGWKLVKVPGGFALVASSGHEFRQGSHGYSETSCQEGCLKDADLGM